MLDGVVSVSCGVARVCGLRGCTKVGFYSDVLTALLPSHTREYERHYKYVLAHNIVPGNAIPVCQRSVYVALLVRADPAY